VSAKIQFGQNVSAKIFSVEIMLATIFLAILKLLLSDS
jgi:hypothetical protein